MISINNILKYYNGKIALKIDFLEIKQGELIGLVGNNGAGKTTLFRLLLDLVRPDSGEALLKNKNVTLTEEWKKFTTAYLDENFLIDYLTPLEYFYFLGSTHNLSEATIKENLKTFEPFLEEGIFGRKYIRDLSKGNQFKVGIVACLLQDPELLILDEPFANLDPSSQMTLIKILKEFQEKKRMTILISSHDLNHITDICKRILLMEKGFLIKDIHSSSNTIYELENYFKV